MHEGHRSRLIGKIKNSNDIYEHEALEILLFKAYRRRDMNALAHALIAEFGSIEGVLNADAKSLVKVDGVGVGIAEYLACLGKCIKTCSGSDSFACIRSTAEFIEYTSLRKVKFCVDTLELYFLDSAGRVGRICSFSGEGGSALNGLTESGFLRLVSAYKPVGVFAAHYRAGRDNTPAEEDDAVVGAISKVGAQNGVRLYDYCVVGADKVYSYFVEGRQATDGTSWQVRGQ